MTQTPFTFSVEDIRKYCLEQLELDSRKCGEHLTMEEYRQVLAMLVQTEQAQALQRIASSLEGFEAR